MFILFAICPIYWKHLSIVPLKKFVQASPLIYSCAS